MSRNPNVRLLIIFGMLLPLLNACGTSGSITKRGGAGKPIESGKASWYGPNFHGKLTANGEIYDMNAMTAAHRTLPFNTYVKVENLDNGQSTVVRINDRGPFAKNRIIDLSKEAARSIGMLGPGTARVRLILVQGNYREVRSRNLKVATYTIQLGSFTDRSAARKQARTVTGARVKKVKLNGRRPVYRVYFGTYKDRDKAERQLNKLARRGFKGYIKQLEN